MFRLRLFFIIFVLFGCVLGALTGFSAPTVKVSDRGQYWRIIFPITKDNTIASSVNGNVVVVKFGSKIDINLRAFAGFAEDFLQVKQNKDNNILLTLSDRYSYMSRDFIGEGYVGFDLIKQPVAQKKIARNSSNKREAETDSKIGKKVTRIVERNPVEKVQKLKQTKSVLTTKDTAFALNEVKEALSDFGGHKKRVVFEKLALATSEDKVSDPSSFFVTAQKKPENITYNQVMRLPKIIFPWQEDVGAAVFRRGEYLWMVFDKPMEVSLKDIVKDHIDYFSEGEQILNKQYTILRFKLKKPVNFIAYKREDKNWVISYSDKNIGTQKPIEVEVKTSKLQGTRVFLKDANFSRFLRITDPKVGDELVIVPSSSSSSGIASRYKYQDFFLLRTAQGVAIQILADKVGIVSVDKGLEVAGITNRLSAESWLAKQLELERKKKEASKNKQQVEKALLKFKTWSREVEGGKAFLAALKDLEWNVINADWENKGKARLELARYYFAHGLYAETIGIIRTMKQLEGEFAKSEEVVFLEGVTLFLMDKYKEADAIFETLTFAGATEEEKEEMHLLINANTIKLSNMINMDKFITNVSSQKEEKKTAEEIGDDQVELTKLILETSSRLLKMIKKIDSDMANKEEVQTLESTARFVTSHYQDAMKRFEETEVYRSGNAFEAEESVLWWNVSGRSSVTKKVDIRVLDYRDAFLKNYPVPVFNNIAMVALEENLRKGDLNSAEALFKIFKEGDHPHFYNSLEFMNGLLYAKDEEYDKAVGVWEVLASDVIDRYNRARAQFAMTNLLLRNDKITIDEAIERLNSVRITWRGGVLELNMLKLLGELYINKKDFMEGMKVWRQVVTNFPTSDDALLIARKMSEQFVYLFNGGGADSMTQIEALTLFYEFRELIPIGKRGDQMIQKVADRLIEMDLLDRAAAMLTHQVRFRLTGEEKDEASTRLAQIHMMNNKPVLALDVLNATDHDDMEKSLRIKRRYLQAKALIEIGRNNQALRILRDDDSHTASFLRADVYWRNKIWYKVIDELEQPFKEIVRQEKELNIDQSEQVVRLAVAYALTGNKRRLRILYEDFVDFIADQRKKDLLTFIAMDRGPVDHRDLNSTVELKELEDFIGKYIKVSENGS